MRIFYDVSVSSDYTSWISLGYFYFMASLAVYIKDLPNINFNIFSMGWRSLLICILEGIKTTFDSLKFKNEFMHGDDFKHDQSNGPAKKNNHIFSMNDPNNQGNNSASGGGNESASGGGNEYFFWVKQWEIEEKEGELANLLKSEDESAATFKGNKRLFNEKDNDVDLKEAQDRADAIKKLTREIKAYKSVLRDMRDEARNDR